MINITRKKEIDIYVTPDGRQPFVEWLESLKDRITRSRIRERLDRISLGNIGDYKSIGEGVMELRFKFGSGYRIYFGEDGDSIILLLCGGDKGTQVRDIKKAKKYWQDYLMR